MSRIRLATALIALVSLAAASPGAAQNRRPNGERGGDAQREQGGQGDRRGDRGRAETRRGDDRDRAEARRGDDDARARTARPRDDRGSWDGPRGGDRRRDSDRAGGRARVESRPNIVVRPRVQPYYRGDRRDVYRGYPRRSYVVPYGYRPSGYRPGWNVNLYFGRPYNRHVYGAPVYGYYALQPGFSYGALRIVDAPRYAQVFVDGYYAGVVDEYDGVFQRLNLESGPHHIEIEVDPGAPPMEFDVYITPGETVTYHARYY